jgi:hypothetical protein
MAPFRPALRRLLLAFKIAGGIFLGLAVLASVALVAVFGYLERAATPERLKAAVTEGLGRATGRPVSIRRAFVTLRGLRLRGLSVYDKEGAPPAFQCRSALLTVSIAALLRERRIRFATLALDGPELDWPAAGWSPPGRPGVPAPVKAVPERLIGLPVAWSVEKIRIDNGVARFRSRAGGSDLRLDNLRVAAGPFRFFGSLPFEWKADWDWIVAGARFKGSGRGKGTVRVRASDWRRATVEDSGLRLHIVGLGDIKGRAKIGGFPEPDISLDVESPAVSWGIPRKWLGKPSRAALPAAHWSGRARWSGKALRVDSLTALVPEGRLQGGGVIDDSGPDVVWHADIESQLPSLKRLEALVSPPMSFSADGDMKASVSLSGVGGKWKVLSARLQWGKARLSTPDFDVLGADVLAQARENFSTIDWAVSRGTVRWLDEFFRGIKGAATLAGGRLSIEKLFFAWGKLAARLSGRLDGLPRLKRLSVAGSITRVEWERAATLSEKIVEHYGSPRDHPYAPSGDEAWVKALKYSLPNSFPALSGNLKIFGIVGKDFLIDRTNLRWSMDGLTPALHALNGSLAATLGPGRVGDIKSVQESSKILKILFLPYIYMYRLNHLAIFNAATAYPRSFAFSRIGANYIVKRGRIDSRYFYVRSPEFSAFADGSADFADETVDLRVLTQLTHYQAPLPEYLVDEEGRPAISFHVRGNLNHPNIDLDLRKMGAHEVEAAILRARRGSRAAARS